MVNPLLWSLAESKHLGCCAYEGLLRLMSTLSGCQCRGGRYAGRWCERHGDPTYPAMEEWAAAFAQKARNMEAMQRVRTRHDEIMKTFSAEELKDLSAYMPADKE